MWRELKKQVLKKAVVKVSSFALIVIVLLVVFMPYLQQLVKGPEELNAVPVEALDGAYVTNEFTEIYDYFAEYYEVDKNKEENVTKRFYFIPYGDDKIIAMELGSNKIALADQIMDEYYGDKDYTGASIKVKGTIVPMPYDISGHYKSYFTQAGYTEEEMEGYVYPYVLKPDYIGDFPLSGLYFVIGGIFLSILWIIVIVIKLMSGAYLTKIKKSINQNDAVMEEYLDADYSQATTIESIKIGRLYTFFFKGVEPNILKNDQIVWAYLNEVTHRVNGIKTSVTKSLIMLTKDKKKHQVIFRKRESVYQVLDTLRMVNSKTVIGFSDELERCYKNDFERFLTLNEFKDGIN